MTSIVIFYLWSFAKKRINKFWTCDSAACRCLNSFLFIFQFYLPKFNLFTLILEFLSVHNITTQIDWQIRDKCFCNLKTSHFCLFVLSKQLGNDSHDVFCSRLCKFQSIGWVKQGRVICGSVSEIFLTSNTADHFSRGANESKQTWRHGSNSCLAG